jgi:hypothetical protein
MKHARPNYERFQDPEGKIPQDEPVMLFRAQDYLFVEVLLDYATRLRRLDGVQEELIRKVIDHAHLGLAWQEAHGCKVPDLPRSDSPESLKVVGVAGFEPATPASRTHGPHV